MANDDNLRTMDRLFDLHKGIDRALKTISPPPETREAAERFSTNAIRVAYTAALPWRLIRDFTINGHLMSVAMRKATNGNEWRWHNLTRAQQRLAYKHFGLMMQEQAENNRKKRDAEKAMAISDSRQAFNRIVLRGDELHKTGIAAVMASIIVSAWTAFEALAEDLWVAALNARPRLGLIAMDAEIKDSDKEDAKIQKLAVTLSLPVWLARDPAYKICEHFGDLLRKYSGRDWQRREKALKSYEKVFPDSRQKMQAIFQDRELRWLQATRNAIVHNGAVADKEFRSIVHDHPRLSAMNIHDPIPIDGALTHSLSMAGIQAGTELLDFVNSWIRKNPA